ncbi:MAG: Calx-beta domain-containing protein [Acidobacteriota bacterium]
MIVTNLKSLIPCAAPLLLSASVFGQPSLSVGDTVVQYEGNSGSSAAVFTVTRSATGTPCTVQYATEDNSAIGGGSCGAGADYVAASGTLSFAAGDTTKTITVSVCGDTTDEPVERFALRLRAPNGASVADDSGWSRIEDDDPTPGLRVAGSRSGEGNALSTDMVFSVTLTGRSASAVRFDVSTAGGTARQGTACSGGADFIGTRRSAVEITAGSLDTTIAVPVCGDPLWENDETFTVSLSNPINARVDQGQGVGTITDDDPPLLSIRAPAEVREPAGAFSTAVASFQLELSEPTREAVSVRFTTVDGTAVRSRSKVCDGTGDYLLAGGVAEIAPGRIHTYVTVRLCHDTVAEAGETFQVQLSNSTGATLGRATASATILDND